MKLKIFPTVLFLLIRDRVLSSLSSSESLDEIGGAFLFEGFPWLDRGFVIDRSSESETRPQSSSVSLIIVNLLSGLQEFDYFFELRSENFFRTWFLNKPRKSRAHSMQRMWNSISHVITVPEIECCRWLAASANSWPYLDAIWKHMPGRSRHVHSNRRLAIYFLWRKAVEIKETVSLTFMW